ncbi:MAG: hypothetical protein CO114_05415 [Euryarchaeota archaeon CG_4_9_14_3_um_filter_38_12]|nr:MAG: hypothetical protein CO114_05415 [Euryarchaeota archaeon CG_4_9_14_3_um_filter_38_12]
MKLYTIGFAKKNAKEFFEKLEENKIQQLVDIRLNNTSQLAGFTKKSDFEYFLKKLCNIDYYHFKFLAPTKELLDKYKNNKNWDFYVNEYKRLLVERRVLDKLNKSFFKKRTCLLCSEPTSEHCHRRLVAEYLKEHWNGVEVVHL